MTTENTNTPVSPAAPKPSEPELTAAQMIDRCMQRATSITIKQRRNKKGTSITISFSKPR
jgi:hypothetical protein